MKIILNKMNILKKIAAVIALFIGFMSVFAGSKVLLGIATKDYTILRWLVSYNVLFGAISIFVAYLIWQNKILARNLTFFILAMHFMVFLYLKLICATVATESIRAMLFRTGIWIVIVVLSILIPKYFNKQQH